MSINRNLAKFAPSINTSGKAAVATITVTVSGGKYYIDGTQQQTMSLAKGITYRLDNSDSTNSGHPLVFSTQSNGAGSAFTTGITTVGTAGSAGAYVEVTLEQDAPDHLGYYCSNHSGMGGLVKTAPIGDANFASFGSTFTFPTSDGSANQVLKTDGSGTLSFTASYGNSDVDSHLNQSNPTSGYVLSWNGSDYAWVDNAGYTDSDVDTHLNRSSAGTNQILSWNGSDYAWVDDQSGSGGIASVLADTTPQLGGNLDVNGQSIVSASNGNIAITPNGTGKIILDGLSFPTSDGSANQVLKTDGSGQLGFVDQASGGGGSSFTATADGALSDGTLVAVNADGTVSNVYKTFAASLGSKTTFESGTIGDVRGVFDPDNNKVIIVYSDSTNNLGKAIVGTVSGTTITYGSAVTFNGTGSIGDFDIGYDTANDKVVIAYRDYGNSSYGTCIVGTVSGTSISFGTEVVFKSGTTQSIRLAFDTANSKFAIFYASGTSSGNAVVGTVSGTSISFGSEATFESANSIIHGAVYDPDVGRVLVSYRDGGNGYYGTVAVGTISSTSITFGTPVVFNSSNTLSPVLVYDTAANKVVVIYGDVGNSLYGTAKVGTVSGTSISFGSGAVFESAACEEIGAAFDANAGKVVVVYDDGGNSNYGTYNVGTVSGTSISFGTAAVFASSYSLKNSLVVDTNLNKTVILSRDHGSSSDGTGYVFSNESQASILTSENFVGISDGAYANGATATIQTAGSTDDAQSGLTPGQSYYVQANGTLGLSPDTIEVLAGTAISSTELLINPDTNPATFGTSQVDAHLNVSTASSGQILSWNGSDYAWVADQQGTSGLSPVNTHSQTISSNTTIAATDNGFSVGAVSVASGVTLTISSGARYAII